MYKMYDKAAAIREIQGYLQKAETTTRYVAPSGVYDEATREAVTAFQVREGLNPTGKVDYITFEALYDDYLKRQTINKTNDNTRQNVIFPLKRGDYGEGVGALNKMLSRVLDFYGAEHSLRASEYFSESTERAQLSLRRIFGLPPGDVDQIFYDRLLTETRSIGKY